MHFSMHNLAIVIAWMFHSRKLNNKINTMHEKCLLIVYNDNTSSFEELLEIDNSISVHQKDIQVLVIELYKIMNGLSPIIMKDVFPLNNNLSCNNGNRRIFHSRPIKSVAYGSETLPHHALIIWELVLTHMKSLQSVASFESAIKKWKLSDCPCRLCRTYIFQLGFV